jgi:hypothetical protein
MPMQPQLFTISAASVETGRDRRTISAALYGVKPDGKRNGHDAWRMRTILNALDGSSGRDSANGDLDEAGRLVEVLTQGLARIEAARSLDKRRKIFQQIAGNFGALDELLTHMSDTLLPHEKDLLVNYQQMVLSGLLRRFLVLCKYEVQ